MSVFLNNLKDFLLECNSIEGRYSRKQFWLYPLGILLLVFLLSLVFAIILGDGNIVSKIIGFIGVVEIIIVSIFSYIKRLHDLNRAGWYFLYILIPILGGIGLLIYCGFFKGTEGENRYGKNN